MKKLRRALLIGNAETLPPSFLHSLAAEVDLVLATDGGANRALAAGLCPDVIIGDLDSVSAQTRKKLSKSTWIPVSTQQNTDLEKALDWLASQQITHCTLCAITGGRMDFTLGNFLSVYPYLEKMELTVCAPTWTMLPVTRKYTTQCQPGQRVSLLPFKTCKNVSTSGLKYPLQNECLSWKQPGRFLSNQTTGKRFSVTLSSGLLWIYHEH